MATETATQPTWFSEVWRDYQAAVANTFGLYGGVFDYAECEALNLPVRDYLARLLARRFAVARYSPDEGIEFPNDQRLGTSDDRKTFDMISGLGGSDEQAQAAALLRGEAPAGGGDDELPSAPTMALPLLAKFLRSTLPDHAEYGERRPAVIVDRLDLLCPPGDKGTLPDGKLATLSLMHRLGTDPAIDKSGGICLMLSPTQEEVHADLRAASSGIRFVEIAPPTFDARLSYIRRLLEERGTACDLTDVEFAAATAGCSRRNIEDIALRAVKDGVPINRELVNARKAEQMASEYDDVLEVMESDHGFETVAGHELAVEFMLDEVVAPMQDPELNDEAPTGILLMGPSGTGKTYMAQALAKTIGFHCLLLQADKIKGSYVGESERRLEKAISGIEAQAPCLVFVDEIDQKVRRAEAGAGDGGSAVEANIFGRLLEFFGDSSHRGRIVVIGATNRPDLIDAALIRPGRFDTKIPLLPPQDPAERAAIVRKLCARYSLDGIDDAVIDKIGWETEDWTQAELERLVVKARRTMRIKKVGAAVALVSAHSSLRTSTRDVKLMTRLALQNCDDNALIPEKYRAVAEEAKKETTPTEAEVRRARAVEL
jgi:transitional endoplasmic reticulum ATPase